LRALKRVNAVYVLIAVMIVVLPILATLQLSWLEKMAKTQLDRTLFVYQSDAEQAAASVDQQIESVYQSIRYHSVPRSFDDVEILFSDVQTAMNKKHGTLLNDLMTDIFWIRFSVDNEPDIQRFSPDSKTLSTVNAGRLDPLVDYLAGFQVAPFFDREKIPVGLFGDVMVMLVPLVDSSFGPGEFGCVVMVLDQEYFSEKLIRPLTEQYFCKTNNPHLSLAVIDKISETLLFSTDPDLNIDDYSETETSADLFNIHDRMILVDKNPVSTGGDTDAPKKTLSKTHYRSVDLPGQWSLLVRHQEGSLAAHVSSLHQRNVLLGSAVFLVLAGSFILLAVLARRAQRLTRLQQEFIGGVSHELRTPLAVISAAGENLADDVVQDSAAIRKYGKLIQKEGKRLHNMVEGVLQFTRLQSTDTLSNPTEVDLADLIAEILDQFNHQLEEAGFSVECNIPENLPLVFGDRPSLGTALGNLISNALKYGKDGAWLGISAEIGKDKVVVSIRDKGPGVDPGERKNIFKPFYRTCSTRDAQIPGSGLGLNIVDGIIARHNGRIEQENIPGGGSRFSISLPVFESDHGEKS